MELLDFVVVEVELEKYAKTREGILVQDGDLVIGQVQALQVYQARLLTQYSKLHRKLIQTKMT